MSLREPLTFSFLRDRPGGSELKSLPSLPMRECEP
jgi:hypothetical protein